MAEFVGKNALQRYSYADYLKWDDGKRYEILDGLVYDMNAPLRVHQEVLLSLARKLADYFDDKPCSVYVAPFDVRLAKTRAGDDDVFTVVQPDISVVCDEQKLDDRGCMGAPDLVVEITSPATAGRDHIQKRRLYENSGVKEYWLIDPTNRIAVIYVLQNDNRFKEAETLNDQGKICSSIFVGLAVELTEVFPFKPAVVCENPPPGFSNGS